MRTAKRQQKGGNSPSQVESSRVHANRSRSCSIVDGARPQVALSCAVSAAAALPQLEPRQCCQRAHASTNSSREQPLMTARGARSVGLHHGRAHHCQPRQRADDNDNDNSDSTRSLARSKAPPCERRTRRAVQRATRSLSRQADKPTSEPEAEMRDPRSEIPQFECLESRKSIWPAHASSR